MESIISKAYYNPRVGFVSPLVLFNKLKSDHPTLKLAQVQEFINQQLTGQITKKTKRPREYSTIQAPSRRSYYQIDLMIYDRYTYHNYKYILVVVDVYSRYAMARALTNRTLSNIMKHIKEIFHEMGKPNVVQCDNEFNKKSFNDYCQENNILTEYSLPDEINKNVVVERLNRTIADILQRWRVATGRHDWYDVLNEVMYNYNHNRHSAIKAKPIDVWERKDINHQTYKVVKYPLKVGDQVRLARSKGIFDKGDTLSFSKQVHTIREIDGIKVYLDDFTDWVKPYQLMKIDKVQHYPEPIPAEPEQEHLRIQKQRKLKRDLTKEGIEENQVALRRSARERKPESQLESTKYGRIKY